MCILVLDIICVSIFVYHPNQFSLRSIKSKGDVSVVTKKSEWDTVLARIPNYDFYHTYDYHSISTKRNEKPLLITYREMDKIIAMPLVIRNIGDTGYNDATSAYGYCGPIHNDLGKNFCNESFARSVNEYLRDMLVVSAFSRLNPYIENQNYILNGFGEVSSLSKVVNIDLSKDSELQQKSYNSRLRTYINKCRKNYLIREAETEEEIKKFVSIYYENMLRVNAKDRYFFPGSYFINLKKSRDFKARFLLAFDRSNSQLAGGAVFVEANNIIQYHLSGARREYLKLNPIKVLIDDMRIRSLKGGFKYFNLGGGVGNQWDSLFRFKAGYSRDFKTFKVWKYIVDQNIYDKLVHKMDSSNCIDGQSDKQFFPRYRHAEV